MPRNAVAWAGLVAALMTLGAPAAGVAAEIVTPADCSPADANPCLTAALERAEASHTDVVLTPGTYEIASPVHLRSGVSLFGTSQSVLRPSAGNAEGVLLLYGGGVSDIRIEGITFDGGGPDYPSESAMIVLDGTQDVVLSRVTLQHSRGSALAVYSDNGIASSGNGVEDSLIFDIGNHWRTTHLPSGRMMGLDFWDNAPLMSHGNFVRYSVFRDIGLDAVHMAGQQGMVVEGNIFELKSEQPDVLVVGDFPAAVFAETSADLTVRNNSMTQAMGNCIDLPGDSGVLIEANSIIACGQSGIGVFRDYDFDKRDSSNFVIRDNVILNSGIWKGSPWQAGISIGGGKPKDIVISGNLITDMRPKGQKTQDYGIEVVNDPGANISTKVSGLVIEASNRLDGNQRAKTHGVP